MTSHTGTLLGGAFQSLRDVGAFQYVLFPLLTWAVIFGVLRKIDIFEGRKDLDAIIALVIALFAAIYVPVGGNMVVFLSNMFGAWALVLVVLVLAMTGAGLLGWTPQDGGWLTEGGKLVAVLALIFIFLSWGGVSMISSSQLAQVPIFLTTQDFLALIVVALGVLAVWYVGFSGEEGGKADSAADGDDD